jgi:hypothetical protein
MADKQKTDAEKAQEAYERGRKKAEQWQRGKDQTDYTPRPGGRNLKDVRRSR